MNRKTKKKDRRENLGPSPILMWILVLILLVAMFFLINSSLFNVSEITVVGTSRFSQQDVINASGINYDMNILQIDEEAARTGIESIPYFEVENIERTFPTGVIIYIKERTPVAQIGTINGYYIIDDECNALAVNSVKDDNLITVSGIGLMAPEFGKIIVSDDENKVQGLEKVLSSLSEYSVLDKVSEVNIEEADSVFIIYQGTTVKIGSAISCKNKIAVLEATYNAVKDKLTDGKVLNMENEGGFFIG